MKKAIIRMFCLIAAFALTIPSVKGYHFDKNYSEVIIDGLHCQLLGGMNATLNNNMPFSLEIKQDEEHKSLSTIVIPSSVTMDNEEKKCPHCQTVHTYIIGKIDDKAFYECELNSSITIPGTVTEIGEHAFESSKFNSIEFQPGLVYIDDWAFFNMPLEKVVLPESLIKLGKASFGKCNNLKEIDLPSTLKHIEDAAFIQSANVTKIICRAKTPPYAEESSFGVGDHVWLVCDCDDAYVLDFDKCVLYVPKESLELYKNAPGWSRFYSRIDYKGDICLIDNIKTIEDDLPLAEIEEVNEERGGGVNYVADKGEVSMFCQAGDELTICNSEGTCLLREKISEPRVVTHRGEGIRIISVNGNSVKVKL